MVALVLAGAGWALLVPQGAGLAGEKPLKSGAYTLSGPHFQDNLTVYLVHGADQLRGRKFMMLAEALDQKKFVIHETQQVNQLQMENLSDTDVVILAGDILKGGQQDRIAQYDQIVPAKSGKRPLAVFCVERTAERWMKPLTAKDRTFASCPGQICTNDLRVACRLYQDQSAVWKEVGKAQDKFSANAMVDAKAKESVSSLALSLKVKEVQAKVDRYVAALAKAPDGKDDVVGYVYAINGKVLGADIYGSPVLFRRVWPRLVRASAAEAFAEVQKGKTPAPPGPEAFRAFLEASQKGKTTTDASKGLRQTTNEAARLLRFETSHPAARMKAAPLRVNIFAH
jgi:hypothetical protein